MIQKFNDYDKIQVYEGGRTLPEGGYELNIIGAKVENFQKCSILKIAFDIVSGEYSGFYRERFERAKAQSPDAKWGGVFDVFLPRDDGSELDGYTKQAFKRFITAVEKSNPGYVWDWNEATLRGRNFGGVFGREQFRTQDGQFKWATKCRFARSVEAIREGNFTVPDEKYHKDYHEDGYDTVTPDMGTAYSGVNASDFETLVDDANVPF